MEKVKKKGKVFNIIINSIMMLLIVVCLSVLFFNLTHTYHYVEGSSMQPTLNYTSEDAVISSKIKSRKRGDIIILEKEERDSNGEIIYIIKRLIALEGDQVAVKLVDDQYRIILIKKGETEEEILEENYLISYENNSILYKNFYNMAKRLYGVEQDGFLTIPENHIFYLGDNRLTSSDCASYGTKSKELIVGKVDYIIYGKKDTLKQVLKQMFGR